ncbi:MAG: hypothetical protein ACSHXD_07305 [Marinosulfonomonas sp.]
MSDKVIDFPRPEEGGSGAHFGVCPVCKNYSGCLNIGRDHWFYCETHKTKWWIGSNLFSSWRNQTDEEHSQNASILSEYSDVTAPPAYREKTPDHRETGDNYAGELFRYGDYRVVLCRDGIQWIIQRHRKGAAARWKAFGYCTTRAALARLWATHTGENAAEISALPEFIRRAK